jgi:hypothetical protein
MNLKYEGLEEYLISLIDALEKDIRVGYKKNSLEDIDSVAFTRAPTLMELRLNDEEYLFRCAYFLICQSKKTDSMVEKLQKYLGAINALEIYGVNNRRKLLISGLKQYAATQRWKTDPKSGEKAFVKDCWLVWKKTPTRYKSKIAFATDMLEKCEFLTSTKVIEDWCRKWDKEKM